MTLKNEDAIVSWLVARGARTIAHPGGTLLSHLQRTASRLASWGAVEPLVAAGRFTGRLHEPSKDVLRQLIDLSCANELDLFLYGPETTRRDIANWLTRCRRSASPAAGAALALHLRT